MTYNYGPKDTNAFVVNYGFVPHKNTIDRTPFAGTKDDLMFLFWKNTVREHNSKEEELEGIRMMDGVVSRMIDEVSHEMEWLINRILRVAPGILNTLLSRNGVIMLT